MPVSVFEQPQSSHSQLSTAIRDSLQTTNSSDDQYSCLNTQLESSTKHILLTKIDYEEINNYKLSQDKLKSKYIVLTPKINNHNLNKLILTTNNNNNDKPNGTSSGKSNQKKIYFIHYSIQLIFLTHGFFPFPSNFFYTIPIIPIPFKFKYTCFIYPQVKQHSFN